MGSEEMPLFCASLDLIFDAQTGRTETGELQCQTTSHTHIEMNCVLLGALLVFALEDSVDLLL